MSVFARVSTSRIDGVIISAAWRVGPACHPAGPARGRSPRPPFPSWLISGVRASSRPRGRLFCLLSFAVRPPRPRYGPLALPRWRTRVGLALERRRVRQARDHRFGTDVHVGSVRSTSDPHKYDPYQPALDEGLVNAPVPAGQCEPLKPVELLAEMGADLGVRAEQLHLAAAVRIVRVAQQVIEHVSW